MTTYGIRKKKFQMMWQIRAKSPKYTSCSYNTTTTTTIKMCTENLDRHFSKEDKQIANKHRKRCSTWLLEKWLPRWHLFFCSTDVSNSSWPHELQHTRLPCPSPPPRVYSNSSPSSLWFHPSNSCVFPVFSCLQSFPASGSFLMSQLFISAGQRLELQLQHQSFQ